MANDYAPKLFLRHAEIALLTQYFAARGELGDLDWGHLKEADVDPIHEAWQALPNASLEAIDSDFRAIFDLASAEGMRTLIEEGDSSAIDLPPALDTQAGFVNKALWVFLNHRRIFDVAHLLDRADHLNRRYWRKRTDLPKKPPDLSPAAMAELEHALSAYYRERQGRGRHCHVDTYLRGACDHYFFAYPQDYTDTFIGYDTDGQFERKRQTPAFEVIYVYDPLDGTLGLYAQGGKDIKQDLQALFARTVLHEELSEATRDAQPYDLNGLKTRAFAFPSDPADRITEVRVKELRLSVLGHAGHRITFDATPTGATDEIWLS